jgi:RNA polymerase sigma-70 factor (ECF subfamily)
LPLKGLQDLNQCQPADIKVLKQRENRPLDAILAAGPQGMQREVMPVTQQTGTEAALVERAQRADSTAFEVLYRAHVDKVYGLCLRMTGNAAEAEDCTQDAFIQAWSKLDKFRGDSAFGTWMHRVAVNTVLGRMRKSKREHDRIQAVSDVMNPPDTIGDSSSIQDLEEAMNNLPRGARHVFVLYAVYGYSHDETGGMLGIAAGTSKAQLHRAKRLLAQQLDIDE